MMDVETIFDSDREEYEFMQEKKEKQMKEQIEEMWNIITTDCDNKCVGCEFENEDWCFTRRVVKELYNAGYRKKSEGEWIFEFNLDGDDFYKCSVCGRQEVLNGLCNERNIAKHLPYCHCGAKMKGADNG